MNNTDYIHLIIERLKPLKPYRVILFGSHAYGTVNEDSDIDLLVVTNDEFIPQSFREKMDVHLKMAKAIQDIRGKIAVDLLVYTKPMYEKFIQLDSMFCREIVTKGNVLYESHHESVA